MTAEQFGRALLIAILANIVAQWIMDRADRSTGVQ